MQRPRPAPPKASLVVPGLTLLPYIAEESIPHGIEVDRIAGGDHRFANHVRGDLIRVMASASEAQKGANYGFLRSEIEIGMAFLDIAEANGTAEIAPRNYQDARIAHDLVSGLLLELELTKEGRRDIHTRLSVLTTRLGAVRQLL